MTRLQSTGLTRRSKSVKVKLTASKGQAPCNIIPSAHTTRVAKACFNYHLTAVPNVQLSIWVHDEATIVLVHIQEESLEVGSKEKEMASHM